MNRLKRMKTKHMENKKEFVAEQMIEYQAKIEELNESLIDEKRQKKELIKSEETRIEQMTKQIEDYQQETKTLKQTIIDDKQQYQHMDAWIKEFETQNKEYQKNMNDKDAEIEHYQSKLNEKVAVIDELASKVAQMTTLSGELEVKLNDSEKMLSAIINHAMGKSETEDAVDKKKKKTTLCFF